MATLLAMAGPVAAAEFTLESAPPVVVQTTPVAGAENIDPALTEIQVRYSKPMRDGSWSWSTWGRENYPDTTGQPRYLPDHRTCVLPVKLEPGRFYAIWLNSDQFHNFKDAAGNPAVPYLLTFTTRGAGPGTPAAPVSPPEAPAAVTKPAAHPADASLNDSQRRVLEWTDRQFRGFFDDRTFTGWADKERADLEARQLDALKGPRNRDYYVAINTLAALRSTNALPALRELAFDRHEKDNRDRWMAVRALGMLGDVASVPELIHLVYHGNSNTRWWAQISLVRLTRQNFGSDWAAWADWWKSSGGQPPYNPEVVRWWSGQAEAGKLAESLAEADRKFLDSLPR